MSLRRPLIATSINIPILQPDLVSRMVPIEMEAGRVNEGQDELDREWAAAQPRVFGALLDHLTAVMSLHPVRLEDPPRLAVLARFAAAVDVLAGREPTATVSRLVDAPADLRADGIGDDPFFVVLRRRITSPWSGSASDLLDRLDEYGAMSRQHGKHWPTAKAVSSRLKKHRLALEAEGWALSCGPGPRKQGTVWSLVPPPPTTEI